MDATEPLATWAAARDGEHLYFNASAVAMDGRGVLLIGPSGCGKSSIALTLMSYGGQLVSDDGVWLKDGMLVPPETAPELIEARGIGLLNSGPLCPTAPLSLIVDLSVQEEDRLPPRRFVAVHDQKVTLIRALSSPTLGPAILQLVRQGRADL